jgi:cytochrome b
VVRVWDVLVRFTHWAVALSFFVAYLTDDDVMTLHVWAGYVIGSLVVLRLFWGFVGPRHARFTDFVTGPRKVLTYLVDLVNFRAERHLGHSPAAGAMAIALWIGLLATVWSGLELYAVEENAGPLASGTIEQSTAGRAASNLLVLVNDEDNDENDDDKAGEDRESAWEEIHEVLANLVLALVVLHLGGVALSSIVHRENLARSMVNGMKRTE